MQYDVVTSLVPGIIITAQSLGQGRIILLIFEWRSTFPRNFSIFLVDNYQVIGQPVRAGVVGGRELSFTPAGRLRAATTTSGGSSSVTG
jgi:hypothetical protein